MLYPSGLRIVEKRVITPEFPARGPTDDYFSLEQKLTKQGFKYLAGGGFSQVYQSPKYPDYVLKVFTDYAYLKYLSATKSSDNPHFPHVGKQYKIPVIGKKTKIFNATTDKIYYGCFIEKLSNQAPGGLEYYVDFLPKYYVKVQMNDVAGLKETPYREITQRWPQWKAACSLITKLIKNNPHGRKSKNVMDHDVFPKNILWRGDVPVLSDPVWEYTPGSQTYSSI